MELRQLRYFKAVADARSFVRAAHQSRVAQPALSRSIAKLEQEMGQSLLVRHSAGVTLTAAGEILYCHVTTVFRDVQRLADDMAADMDTPHGAVSFGAPPSMQTILTAPVAAAFISRYPNANLSVLQNASAPLRDGIANGQVDIAVITAATMARGVHYTPLVTVNFCLICPTEIADRFGTTARLSDLAGLPLILCGYPDTLRQYLDDAFARIDARPNVRCEVNNGSLVADMVAQGAGVGIAPCGVLSDDRERGLISIPIEGFSASWLIATSMDRIGSCAVRKLTQMLVEQVRSLTAAGAWPTARFDGPAAVDVPVRTVSIAPHLLRQFSTSGRDEGNVLR
ncbi:MAG: LysR family transcriptional regulator [Janthinobacterium lividum]